MKTILFAAAALLCATPARGEGDPTALAAQMKGLKVTLAQGLAASASKGKPISAKFELEDGKLQLSVYTADGTTRPARGTRAPWRPSAPALPG